MLALTLFLLDVLSLLEIKSQAVKSFAYVGILVLSPILLVWNLTHSKNRKRRIIQSIIPTLAIAGVLVVGPSKVLAATSSWKTQSILFQNTEWTSNRIEYQIQDVGALGYNERTVEVFYLTGAFMIISEADQNLANSGKWIKVDKEVNEMGLKYP